MAVTVKSEDGTLHEYADADKFVPENGGFNVLKGDEVIGWHNSVRVAAISTEAAEVTPAQ